MLPAVLKELIMSFLKTCRVCHTTYADNMFECEDDNPECGFYKTCDDCRVVFVTHEGPMCRIHGQEWYEAEFGS